MTLLKKLKTIKSILITDHFDLWFIKNLYQSGKLNLIESESFGFHFERNSKPELDKDGTWGTYDRCREMIIKLKDGKIIIDITIWEGESYRGNRKRLRWKATFSKFPAIQLKRFKDNIDYKFADWAEAKYYDEEERKKNKRIKQIMASVIGT